MHKNSALSHRTATGGGADLPPPGPTRWVVRRKQAVVSAVRQGQITLDEACRTYTLSPEEFNSWQRLIDRHGPRGLRATRLQEYRSNDSERKIA
jgi:hypothetical protein